MVFDSFFYIRNSCWIPLSRICSAIHVERRTRHVTRLRACEKRNDSRHLFGCSQTLHRRDVRRIRISHVGVDGSGQHHRVDGDVACSRSHAQERVSPFTANLLMLYTLAFAKIARSPKQLLMLIMRQPEGKTFGCRLREGKNRFHVRCSKPSQRLLEKYRRPAQTLRTLRRCLQGCLASNFLMTASTRPGIASG